MAKARARLVIDESQLRAVLSAPDSKAVRLVQSAQRQTLNAAKIRAPVDTGQLRNSHKAEPVSVQGDKIRATITADGGAKQNYALAVHEGYPARVIVPRRKKFLSWKGPEGRVFARAVNHPGAPARPWLRNALQDTAPRMGFVVDHGD